MDTIKLFDKLREKYSKDYIVEISIDEAGRENIAIGDYDFEIVIPEYATSKKDIMIKTYDDSLIMFSSVESIINAVNRMLK